ncbi:i/6 autoantigen-like protein [Leishmania guyanensis]|uniref:Putative i/6 autoantigen-like protein n=1 Tax=Leishmania guyanensis TaxID=5670 RepID=A0A1E1IWN0_LEIGU|nr:Putative i/6 autoantigen-like protein [Leishmania guyanensis]
MLISPEDAFKKRQVTREDGVEVLPRHMITVAALEAGYCLTSPTIDEAVSKTTYPGQMTAHEFSDFCDRNTSSFISAQEMAKYVVVAAPSGVFTRGSLEEMMNKLKSKEDGLLDEEVEALFTTLDTHNKGAITTTALMRALYGKEGVCCLAERRRLDAEESRRRQEEAANAEKAEKVISQRPRSEPKPQKKVVKSNKESSTRRRKEKKVFACC